MEYFCRVFVGWLLWPPVTVAEELRKMGVWSLQASVGSWNVSKNNTRLHPVFMSITIRSTKKQSREGSVGKYQHRSCAGTHASAQVSPIELWLPLWRDGLCHIASDFQQLMWVGYFLLFPELLHTQLWQPLAWLPQESSWSMLMRQTGLSLWKTCLPNQIAMGAYWVSRCLEISFSLSVWDAPGVCPVPFNISDPDLEGKVCVQGLGDVCRRKRREGKEAACFI